VKLTNSVAIILASTSAYRRFLLEKLQIPFTCESPNLEEKQQGKESAKEMSERLAIEKAKSVAKNHLNGLIIGSDQTACIVGEIEPQKILGKPGNKINAINQLLACQGKTVRFYTGLCVVNAATNECCSSVETFDVVFRNLSKQQITNYVEKELPLDCAGSFKSEGLGIALFDKLEGNDPNTLVGLPLIALCRLLEKFGVKVL
jgi:MAF protein